jgi:hypothetical protein
MIYATVLFCVGSFDISILWEISMYSRDHNRIPVPASALFLTHGPYDRDLSTSELARCKADTVIYTVYYIAVTLDRL